MKGFRMLDTQVERVFSEWLQAGSSFDTWPKGLNAGTLFRWRQQHPRINKCKGFDEILAFVEKNQPPADPFRVAALIADNWTICELAHGNWALVQVGG